MHGIVAQQMGVGLDRAEVVQPDDLDVGAADSAMARSTLRPMRPKPLMKTLTVMSMRSCLFRSIFALGTEAFCLAPSNFRVFKPQNGVRAL